MKKSFSLATAIITLQLVACGGGGSGDGTSSSGGTVTPAANSGKSISIGNNTSHGNSTNHGSNASGGNVPTGTGRGNSPSKDPATSTGDSTTSVSSSALAVSTGSFTLKWVAPVARTDGTPLSLADINGFRIYYGASDGNYEYMVNVPDGTAMAATVKNVPVGTYQVRMTTYDNNGLESGYSSKVTKTVM